jgi:hypothetical protein
MSEYPFFDDDNQMIAWLEEQGALMWDGVADNGEPMFRFDLDKLKDVYPPLYEVVMEEIDDDLMILYTEGLVELEYNENLEAIFKLSEKGQEYFKLLGKDSPFPFLD